MLRKNSLDSFSAKPSRNDRFAQMSRQEQVIEQKKREIQARMQQQRDKAAASSTSVTKSTTNVDSKKTSKSTSKGTGKMNQSSESSKSNAQFNIFTNDGSFLDQFKQLKDTRRKSVSSKGRTPHSEERSKPSRWSKPRGGSFSNREPSPGSSSSKSKSRFSGPVAEFVPAKAQPPNTTTSINSTTTTTTTTTTTVPFSQTFTATSDSDMYAAVASAATSVSFGLHGRSGAMLVAPPPPLPTALGMAPPPPQGGALIAPPPPPPAQSLLPPGMSVPPPPVTAMSLPPPGALQLQNIPSPSPIRLNEIPDPKPIDLLNIPAPGDDQKTVLVEEKATAVPADGPPPVFIKTVPPPNKSIPPPGLADVSVPPPSPRLGAAAPPAQSMLSLQAGAGLIPALMAQPVLPPPPPAVVVVQAAPVLAAAAMPLVSGTPLPGPPPVLSQPPPLTQPPPTQPPPMSYPPPPPPPPPPPQQQQQQQGPAEQPTVDLNAGSASHGAMVSLSRMVAQCGSGIEDIVQQRAHPQDPQLWFLFHKQSAAYQQYRHMVEQFRAEQHCGAGAALDYQPEDIYEPDGMSDDEQAQAEARARRKRKSRWGERVELQAAAAAAAGVSGAPPPPSPPPSLLLSKITRSDAGLRQFAADMFGTEELSEEQWLGAEQQYKAILVSQELERKRRERARLQRAGKHKYEYDSDEDTDGGTWEHKLREREMQTTQPWAEELTRHAEGKHHIGDFLPPDELSKFLERCAAARDGRPPALSDYSEHRLRDDNLGFQMLQKLGWQEGQGLGSAGTGIREPVNKAAAARDQNQGLGLDAPDGVEQADDEYDAYRKRMMLAYRFRPNPLNNPRRPYY